MKVSISNCKVVSLTAASLGFLLLSTGKIANAADVNPTDQVVTTDAVKKDGASQVTLPSSQPVTAKNGNEKEVQSKQDTKDELMTNSKLVVANKAMHEHENVNDNGGFDQDFWGKVDVNDWNYQLINDPNDPEVKIVLTEYKGSTPKAVVIPNSQDFINAGILKEGQKAAIYDLAHIVSEQAVKDNPQIFENGIDKANLDDLSNNNLAFVPNVLSQGRIDYNDMINTQSKYGVGISKTGNATLTILNDNLGLAKNNQDSPDEPSTGAFYNYNSNSILDVSNLDVHHVKRLDGAFANMPFANNTYDLSKWDTSNVVNVHGMFNAGSGYLFAHDIDLSNWDLSQVKYDPDNHNDINDPLSIFDSGSGEVRVFNELNLANMKLPTTTYQIDANDTILKEPIKGSFVPFLLRILSGTGDSESVLPDIKVINMSNNDFSGLSSKIIQYLNDNLSIDKKSGTLQTNNISNYIILTTGTKFILEDVKNFPKLPDGFQIKVTKSKSGEDEIKLSEVPNTKITIQTNDLELIKAIGKENYNELPLEATRTINFEYPESYLKLHPKIQTQIVQKVSLPILSATIANDNNTILNYTLGHGKFSAMELAEIDGYHPEAQIEETPADENGKPLHLQLTIKYVKNTAPFIPDDSGDKDDQLDNYPDTPTLPDTSTDPSKPDKSNETNNPINLSKKTSKTIAIRVEDKRNTQVIDSKQIIANKKINSIRFATKEDVEKLPQTGAKNSNVSLAGAAAIALASAIGIFGLGKSKKRD